MPDQPVFLRLRQQRFMQPLRQLSLGKFGERTGKLRLMRNLTRAFPPAYPP
jgi:hypothetical protein